ncbi:MAG: CoA-binding protein [Rhodoferax sp.]|uniref:CoA-binding protein n=1 Tax=Rhodoferax sp. TaxID=50421 RepID=UPI00179512A2|nr:CoA-binding protein [Rhodoferax sp.]NMM14881.1 CoA-binding protein [Rhodoferax sp.]NMM18969.1 CoA-binding protein [Rhodoferax sp.]
MTQSDNIRHILTTCRTVAVVGLSPKPHRDSFDVARYMQAHGWRIIPVNPVAAASGEPILGEKVYATLLEAAQHEKIELVNVFRNSADVPPVAQEAIAIGAQALWLQLGIENAAAASAAQAAGLRVVQNKCLLVEHAASL